MTSREQRIAFGRRPALRMVFTGRCKVGIVNRFLRFRFRTESSEPVVYPKTAARMIFRVVKRPIDISISCVVDRPKGERWAIQSPGRVPIDQRQSGDIKWCPRQI